MKIKFIILLVLFLIILFVVGKIPVKRAINVGENDEEKEDVFICEYIDPGWQTYNLKTKEYEFLYLEGNVPNLKLNRQTFFYSSHNKFLVKGEVSGKKIISHSGEITTYYNEDESLEEILKNQREEYEMYNIIEVLEWDIISPIDRDSFRIFAPKEYLNLYDFIF